MLHIYQMILLLGTLPIFCCIQLFLVFKCIGVSSHRKKGFLAYHNIYHHFQSGRNRAGAGS